MKTFQIIVLAVFGISALAGLVIFSTMQSGGDAVKTGPVLIWGLLPQDSVDATLAELAVTDKSLANVTYLEKAKETFGTELARAIAEENGPDLVIITQEELIAERAKLIVIPFDTVPERAFIDAYVPLSELLLTDTGTYGMPLTVDPLVMYYNRATLTAAGIAFPPTTWEAVNGLAQSLSVVSQTGAIAKSVIPFGDYANVRNARAVLSAIFFQAGIPMTGDDNGRLGAKLVGEGESGLSTASAAISFFTQFADPAKTVYSWNRAMQNSRAMFLAGDLLLYPGFASERAFIRSANPNLDFDMSALPQPSSTAGHTTYGLVYAAAIPRASFNPSGALSVAITLSGRAESEYLAQLSGMAPAVRASLTSSTGDRYTAIFYPEALRARGWLSPQPTNTDGIFAGMIGNVTSGRQSIPDALQSANDSLDAVLP